MIGTSLPEDSGSAVKGEEMTQQGDGQHPKAKQRDLTVEEIAKLRVLAAQNIYPEPKRHDLTEREKEQIRRRIEEGDSNIYKLAEEFHCSSSQIAGIKAAMSRK